MKDPLFQYWDRLSRREKLVCVAAASVLLLYATYALVLENSLRNATNKRVRLARLNAEYQNLQVSRQRAEKLKGELAGLQMEVEKKRGDDQLPGEGVRSRRIVETLLYELRQTAGKMPLQLVDMDIKTGLVSNLGEFPANSPSVSAKRNSPEGITTIQAGKANCTISKIVLTYRSGYNDAVNYFLKVMELPYAISVNSVEMERGNVGGMAGGPKRYIGGSGALGGEIPLNTKLGIDIFYK